MTPADDRRTLTLRPRFVIAVAVAIGVVALVLLLAGHVVVACVFAGLALLPAFAARARLRIDDAGVSYRGLFGGRVSTPWSEIGQVVVDVVATSSPGSPSAPAARVRLVRRDAPPVSMTLFSRADAARVVEVVRARGVAVLDERG